MAEQLADALDGIRHDATVRAVVIAGAAGTFSAGMDLKDPIFADPEYMTKSFLDSPRNYLWQLRHIEVPVIAAVSGACVTGALEIVLNCDIVLASPSAIFQDTHSKVGIVPAGGMTQLLPRVVGLQTAKLMSLTSEPLVASRALSSGLVSEVVPEARLLERATELAMKAARRDAAVNKTIKRMQHAGQRHDVHGALQYELDEALSSYVRMGQQSTDTKHRLAGKLAARSKL